MKGEKLKVTNYKNLQVWQKAMLLVNAVYKLTAGFPKEEAYALSSQLRRAAVSVPSNIAEGAARFRTKEYMRFISIAHGSLAELETQILIAENQNYVTREKTQLIHQLILEIGRMLGGLYQSLKTKETISHSTFHLSQTEA